MNKRCTFWSLSLLSLFTTSHVLVHPLLVISLAPNATCLTYPPQMPPSFMKLVMSSPSCVGSVLMLKDKKQGGEEKGREKMGGTQDSRHETQRWMQQWMTPRLINSHRSCGLSSVCCVLEQCNVITLNPHSKPSSCYSWDSSLVLPDTKAVLSLLFVVLSPKTMGCGAG